MSRPIYMDHHATTPCAPEVVEAMQPFWSEKFGNAASRAHRYGWEADEAVKAARLELARFVGAAPSEIVFTSGATEANNLALKGMVEASGAPRPHVVTVATEHASVLDPCAYLEATGRAEVTRLPVRPDGTLDLSDLEAAIRPETLLVSVMHANNEIGTLHPVAEIGALAKARGIFFHCDAAQSASTQPLDVEAMGVDLLTLSAHKMYGPKGIGLLYLRRRGPRARPAPLLHGGGHERGIRSGTLPVPLVVGFAAAARSVTAQREAEAARLAALRDRLLEIVRSGLDGVHVNGTLTARLPHNLNLSFEGIDGEALLLALREVALSSGSACASASPKPSHVLRALRLPDRLVRASIRIGLGRGNTAEEVERVGARIVEAVRHLRQRAPGHGGLAPARS
ncbi:MAG: cysteine desulfurase [Deltaproteobacteria bacterium]|nr:MAG: cysteine desulfurase [Deltaproteobacteria bacterium]